MNLLDRDEVLIKTSSIEFLFLVEDSDGLV